ncbi:MAG: MBL fold metallo-hydrolase [Betaproteobacteria bacterium]|nr:MBL fold metallo-hydrolase [Betaproteobacteria bacterium]
MKYLIIPVTSFEQNCSLIWCEETNNAALVDPGGNASQLIEVAAQKGLRLTKLLLTHGHMDHVGAAAELAAKLGIPIEGPQREDAFLLESLPQQCVMFGFPHVANFMPDLWLEHGDLVKIGNVSLEVLHCPGHTPGHIGFFHRASQTAFVGDVLFKGAIGRTDLPRGDYDTLIASIRERLFPLGDDVTFIPGHGPTSTFGYERRTNPYVGDNA